MKKLLSKQFQSIQFLNLSFILIVILVGVTARFLELSRHFSHVDDVGVAKHMMDYIRIHSSEAFTAIPRKWTYAPLQFYITPLLLKADMTYRDLLFWGRLPSALFSSLALIVMAAFYWIYDRWKTQRVLIALGLLAFSWENIVYAKQMHNYALGVTSQIILMIALLVLLKRQKVNYFAGVFAGLLLGVLSWAQYQIIFSLPAFFMCVFFFRCFKKEGLKPFIETLLMGLSTIALLYPLWMKYLRHHSAEGMGVSWNEGPSAQYLFHFDPALSWIQKLVYPIQFFVGNFFITLESNISFVDPENPLQGFFYYLTGILFCLGVFSFFSCRSQSLKKKLGVFLGLNALVWAALVILGKITLSPTRHSLILLPMMTVVVAEGVLLSTRYLGRLGYAKIKAVRKYFAAGLLGICLIVFSWGFPTFLEKRRDLFNENEIVQTLVIYRVDTLIRAHSIQPITMRKIQSYFGDYEFFFPTYGVMARPNTNFERVAWISGLFPLSRENYYKKSHDINLSITARNQTYTALKIPKTIPFFTARFEDYEVIYKKEINNGVEADYNPRIGAHDNAIYFYILDKKKK